MWEYQLFLMPLDIKNDAIFIADAHYNSQRISFENLINDILCDKIQTSQIIFMGDMFDYLSNEVDYFKNINKHIIEKINTLSIKEQIIYLEGNHDYNLKELFPLLKSIPRINQPLHAKYKEKKIMLSHGDIFTPFFYNLYTNFIRNKYILRFINSIDINNFITKKIEKSLKTKDICNKFKNFEQFALKRIELYKNYKYEFDIIIEGHFHQGKIYKNYVNVPSYACKNIYFYLEDIIPQH